MNVVINLNDGTRLEIDGSNIRHIDANENVLYDTVHAVINKFKEATRHFFFLTDDKFEKIEEWIESVKPETDKQRVFINRVKRALKEIDYEFWIATIEPSFDEFGNIYYKEGCEVGRNISLGEWKKRAANYYSDDKRHSGLANLYEGDLFKAYRIAMGYWSLSYVCDNLQNVEEGFEVSDFALSGTYEIGGFCDGVGNTYEIYENYDGFIFAGGCRKLVGCTNYPVVAISHCNRSTDVSKSGSGVLVIR